MTGRRWQLLVAALATCASLGVAVGLPPSMVLPRAVAAFALVAFLPGFALVAALFPTRRIGAAPRTALVLGLSLTISILVGLGLAVTPEGVKPPPYAIALSALTLLLLGAAFGRSGRSVRRRAPLRAPSFRQAMLVALAVLITVLAVVVDLRGAGARNRTNDLAELWLQPVARGAASTIVGVKNLSQAPKRFQLKVEYGTTQVASWPDLRLRPHQTWTHQVDVPRTTGTGTLYATLTPFSAGRAGAPSGTNGDGLKVWVRILP